MALAKADPHSEFRLCVLGVLREKFPIPNAGNQPLALTSLPIVRYANTTIRDQLFSSTNWRGEKILSGPRRSQADLCGPRRTISGPIRPAKQLQTQELAHDPELLKTRQQASPSPGGEGRDEGELHFGHQLFSKPLRRVYAGLSEFIRVALNFDPPKPAWPRTRPPPSLLSTINSSTTGAPKPWRRRVNFFPRSRYAAIRGNIRQYADEGPIPVRILPLKRPLIAAYSSARPRMFTVLPLRLAPTVPCRGFNDFTACPERVEEPRPRAARNGGHCFVNALTIPARPRATRPVPRAFRFNCQRTRCQSGRTLRKSAQKSQISRVFPPLHGSLLTAHFPSCSAPTPKILSRIPALSNCG